MLHSLFLNNQGERFSIYLMHSSITDVEIKDLQHYIGQYDNQLYEIYIDEDHFANAPSNMHYTKEMYYRLLAHKFLPEDIDRILYVDPDVLVINSIRKLYHMDISAYLFAAASRGMFSVKELNKIRFYPIEIEAYHNSGILLMNLERLRKEVSEESVFQFVEEYKSQLILPDQDVLNAMFSKQIKSIDEKIYNYDVRYFQYYKLTSKNEWDMDTVIKNTVFLHFCGKKKPWNKDYSGNFHSLYKHYENSALHQQRQ